MVIPEDLHWVPTAEKYLAGQSCILAKKCLCLKNAYMQHDNTDTKGYGPARSWERSLKEWSIKETNKQLNNTQCLCVCINTSKIMKYNLYLKHNSY